MPRYARHRALLGKAGIRRGWACNRFKIRFSARGLYVYHADVESRRALEGGNASASGPLAEFGLHRLWLDLVVQPAAVPRVVICLRQGEAGRC